MPSVVRPARRALHGGAARTARNARPRTLADAPPSRRLLALALPLGLVFGAGIPAAGAGTIVLNEIRIDQPGTDNDEYVELAGPPAWTLDGLHFLVIGDGTGGSGVIEEAIDLAGGSFGLDGVFLIGQSSMTIGTPDLVTSINFENSDNLTHLLVSGFSGSVGDDLDLDDDGTLDLAPWTEILDAVSTVENLDAPPSGTEWWYAEPVGPTSLGEAPFHVLRCADTGAWVAGADDPAAGLDTPGSANPPCAGLEGCGGDLDLDGDVDADDLAVLLAAWGSSDEHADLDLDGTVGPGDLGWMLAVWGDCR